MNIATRWTCDIPKFASDRNKMFIEPKLESIITFDDKEEAQEIINILELLRIGYGYGKRAKTPNKSVGKPCIGYKKNVEIIKKRLDKDGFA